MRIRIEPRLLREAVRLHYGAHLSAREIASCTGLSRNGLYRLRQHLEKVEFDLTHLDSMSDDQLYQHLGLKSFRGFRLKASPDWNWVHVELRNPSVTLELLWREWRATEPDGIAYSQFTASYRAFLRQRPLVMRQLHLPGDKLFLDFAGQTMPIFLADRAEPQYAQIFVGVLGYSGYTFACAAWSQRVSDWLQCHVKAFNFFGGVSRLLVPDNLKAAVIKHGRDEVQLNLTYQQLAHHYQTTILPARPRKPKDKAKAETGVKLIQQLAVGSVTAPALFQPGRTQSSHCQSAPGVQPAPIQATAQQ
ncbi:MULTISPECIES: IS21 family transposase [Pseudomonas]|uniref:IS21 family transposase n=1 Tax=Pseudomonas TaxID=286 RepID=UPI001472841B|nr:MULTISPECIES: IS21 family transposase [Pseudomonas]MBS5840785.1 IS21 family transposase [Pseudomonas sp.]NNA00284.1 IS21 family transposase [Pseudomonas lundensis]